jgi:hypothetical protein
MATCALLASCGAETTTPATPPDEAFTTGYVRAVDLAGDPVADVFPIATRQANAFDRPVSRGEKSGADGRSSLPIPMDEQYYVRMWDPALQVFANNYLTVYATSGQATDELQVVMVPGAILRASIVLPDGSLLAETAISLLLSHPTQGPWWRAEATTDAEGMVAFDRVPAGQYTAQFSDAEGGKLDVPSVHLDPNGSTDLGSLALH